MSEMLDSAIMGAVARLQSEPKERWISILQEFALEAQEVAKSGGAAQAGKSGMCSDCGQPTSRCAKCAAKAVASGFVKDKAREAVSTYGPILASKGLEWLQAALEEGKRKAEEGK